MLLNLCKMKKYKYFSEEEFNKLSPSCSFVNMNSEFMLRLDYARELAGIPFIINSAYRSSSWDKLHGRSGNGYHTFGRAVDIRCVSSCDRFKIVSALVMAGFTGIGLYKQFIHVDDREATNPVVFYGSY